MRGQGGRGGEAAGWLAGRAGAPHLRRSSHTASNNECMLAIGDGANDVAMLQAADIDPTIWAATCTIAGGEKVSQSPQ